MFTQITVDTGTANPHIFAISDAVIHAAIFGYDYVGEGMQEFEPTIMSQNEIKIGTGTVCIGGHIGCIPHGSYESCTIATGNVGYQRRDLIVARYSRSNGIDYMGLYVYKGVPSVSSPALPAYKTDSILQSEGIREVPLFSVLVFGLNISLVERIAIPKSSYNSFPYGTTRSSYFTNFVRNVITLQKTESFTATFVQDATSGLYVCSKSMDMIFPNEQVFDVSNNESFANGSILCNAPLMFQPVSVVVPPDDNIATLNYKLCSKVNTPVSVSVTASIRMYTYAE